MFVYGFLYYTGAAVDISLLKYIVACATNLKSWAQLRLSTGCIKLLTGYVGISAQQGLHRSTNYISFLTCISVLEQEPAQSCKLWFQYVQGSCGGARSYNWQHSTLQCITH